MFLPLIAKERVCYWCEKYLQELSTVIIQLLIQLCDVYNELGQSLTLEYFFHQSDYAMHDRNLKYYETRSNK